MSSVKKSKLPIPKRLCTRMHKDYSPIKWSSYFENQQEILVQKNIFNVYSSGSKGPVLFLIHGGGYSALTWGLFAQSITKEIDCQICAIDLRGHGNTKVEDEHNLSLETLVKDVAIIIGLLFNHMTPIVLVGHSLGGSIAVSAARLIPNVVGLCVIDVVEGTALKALPSMKNILRNRPKSFKTIEEAIQWSFKDGQTNNLESVRVSMPGQIKNRLTNELAANHCDDYTEIESARAEHDRVVDQSNLEEDEDMFGEQSEELSPNNLYTWRIDLSKTEPYWDGWFTGLSQKFLAVTVPKVLLLANINRLDTALTVGQMQGKYQLQVLPQSGHAIHESHPQRVAYIIAKFLQKQKLAFSKNDT